MGSSPTCVLGTMSVLIDSTFSVTAYSGTSLRPNSSKSVPIARASFLSAASIATKSGLNHAPATATVLYSRMVPATQTEHPMQHLA